MNFSSSHILIKDLLNITEQPSARTPLLKSEILPRPIFLSQSHTLMPLPGCKERNRPAMFISLSPNINEAFSTGDGRSPQQTPSYNTCTSSTKSIKWLAHVIPGWFFSRSINGITFHSIQMPRCSQKPSLCLLMAGSVCANLLGPSACSSLQLSVPHVLTALCRPGRCLSILITGQETPFANHYHREKRQLQSQNHLWERAGYASPFSKAWKYWISYLESKSNMDFEDKKGHEGPSAREKSFSKASHKGPCTTMGSKHLGIDPQSWASCTPLLPWCCMEPQRPSVFS